jgi:hypothetical protein
LFFVTGFFKVPYGGFKNFPIRISRTGDPNQLPVAHTCNKTIDLPLYITKEDMARKLAIAIAEGPGGFYIG